MAKDPYRYFRIEGRELAQGLAQGVLDLEKGPASQELVGRLLRFAHTLKGAARVVRQPAIADLAHAVEDILVPHRQGGSVVAKDRIGELLALVDSINERLRAIDAGPADPEGAARGTAPAGQDVQRDSTRAGDRSPSEVGQASRLPGVTSPGGRDARPTSRNETSAAGDAGDRSERAPRGEGGPAARHHQALRIDIREMDELLDGIAEASVGATALRQHALALEQANGRARAVLDLLDARREGSEAHALATRAALSELRASLQTLGRDLFLGIERAERELDEVRERAHRLRLVPAGDLVGPLERAVRDAAQSLNRRVEFEAQGGESRLDAHVLSAISEALLHVVRNAVAHGIEAEPERVAAGKPPAGKVELLVKRHGSRVTFSCRDDGRGIDVEAIRRAAVRRGILEPAEADALQMDQAVELLFHGGQRRMGAEGQGLLGAEGRRLMGAGGLSTARALTDVAGRGVGLDIVREAVSRVKGQTEVRSERGRGTTVDITVPVSLSSLPVLLIESGGVTASIPLDGVVETGRVVLADVVRGGASDMIVQDGTAIPFLPLEKLLLDGRAPGERAPSRKAAQARRSWSTVVVRSGSTVAALGVDRLRGTMNVVVRPLPAVIGQVPAVAGASFDAHGNPQLVFDPARLVEMAFAPRSGEAPDASPRVRLPILVIDDSLTTRMLEQSILESAGYEVALATSAEEGLEKARASRYGVFIVDVEMPGMDGYEFVTRTRADPVLREVPAILVTSRGSPEDRRRGADAGAHAYIVKGEFDQGRLLEAIAELVG